MFANGRPTWPARETPRDFGPAKRLSVGTRRRADATFVQIMTMRPAADLTGSVGPRGAQQSQRVTQPDRNRAAGLGLDGCCVHAATATAAAQALPGAVASVVARASTSAAADPAPLPTWPCRRTLCCSTAPALGLALQGMAMVACRTQRRETGSVQPHQREHPVDHGLGQA